MQQMKNVISTFSAKPMEKNCRMVNDDTGAALRTISYNSLSTWSYDLHIYLPFHQVYGHQTVQSGGYQIRSNQPQSLMAL